ncbi:hypothetical protein Bca101_060509 [Brassica carinata]
MVISHAQPLLLPLLVSLFFLPAALGVSQPFVSCNRTHKDRVNVRTVDITPHPIKLGVKSDITIRGDTAITIPEGATVEPSVEAAFPGFNKRPAPINRTYNLCDIAKCPVGPDSFMYTLSNLFTEELPLNINIVHISIKDKKDTMMCVAVYLIVG